MSRLHGWDGRNGWQAGPDGAGHPDTETLLTALARSREAMVFGPAPPLPRPAGWPGTRPGDALRGLDPSVRRQLVLTDLLLGLRLHVEPGSVSLWHGRMHHQVSAAGLDPAAELPLLEAKAELRAERAAEILAQCRHTPRFWAAILPISPQRTPYTLELMAAAQAFASHVVHRVKAVLNQPRPADLSPRIQPMLPTPASPGHPSGHATEAALLAGLLYVLASRPASGAGGWGATLKPMLDELAARIAENREIAGLHLPSASTAGKLLGDRLLAALLEAKSQPVDAQRPQDGHSWAWLWQQAAVEWGGA